MDLKKVVEIVDKHVDQEALAKDLVGQLVAPELEKLAAKMESGEIDLVKGTNLDNVEGAKFLRKVAASLKGE